MSNPVSRWFRKHRESWLNRIADRRAKTPQKKEELRMFRLRLTQIEKLYRSNIVRCRKVIDLHGIDVLLLTEDVVGPSTGSLIRAGHLAGIPTIIIPYTMADQTEVKEAWLNNKNVWLRNNFNWFAVLYSWKWIARYKGRWMVRLQFSFIRAQIAVGLTPADPWMINSGEADVIAVDSQRVADYYTAHKFKKNQLAVIGSVYEDEMMRRRSQRTELYAALCAEYGFDPRKPLLVMSAPTNQYTGAGRDQAEFEDYETLAIAVTMALAEKARSHNILVSMHPSHKVETPHYTGAGLTIYPGDLAQLIPMASVFVAFASATIRWAIALGIPAINYDTYRYDYDEFDAVKGTLRVNDIAAFSAALDGLCNDPAFWADKEAKQRAATNYWSMGDDRAGERLKALIAGKIAERQPGKVIAERPIRSLTLVLGPADGAEARRIALALKPLGVDPTLMFDRGVKPDTASVRNDVEASQLLGIRCITTQGLPFAYPPPVPVDPPDAAGSEKPA